MGRERASPKVGHPVWGLDVSVLSHPFLKEREKDGARKVWALDVAVFSQGPRKRGTLGTRSLGFRHVCAFPTFRQEKIERMGHGRSLLNQISCSAASAAALAMWRACRT